MRVLTTCVAVCVASAAGRALACGAAPEPYLTIDAIDSEAGDATRYRDGVVVVELRAWPVDDAADSSGAATVELIEVETGARVEGTYEAFLGGTKAYFRPRRPLAASTQYRLSVVTNPVPRPEIAGASSMEVTFVSGAELAPELVLSGDLSVSLRVGSVDYQECAVINSCGGGSDCTPRSRSALFADVALPVVDGGISSAGYEAVLAYGANATRTFDGPGEGTRSPHDAALFESLVHRVLREGVPSTVSVELFSEGEPYRPCFALNAWDPAGHAQHTEPLCLSEVDVESLLENAPLTDGGLNEPDHAAGVIADNDSPPEQLGDGGQVGTILDAESDPEHEQEHAPTIRQAGACAASNPSATKHTPATWLFAALGLALAARVRRRRT